MPEPRVIIWWRLYRSKTASLAAVFVYNFFFVRFVCERELENKQNCNILTPPPLLWPSALCLSRSPRLLNQKPGGPALCWMMAFSTASCLWFIGSPTHWLPVSLSYIIVQLPTQSLEWHVWSSSSGNNCHAVHRSLSSGASVYDCTMGFYLVPYFQPSPPTRFLLITAIGMCPFLPVHHFGMACLAGSKVNMRH